MSLLKIFLVTALLIPVVPSSARMPEAKWKEIVVLRSTRADVEKLMGKEEEHAGIVYYPIKEGSVQIEYSDGLCEPSYYNAWDVPEGTVIEVVYNPFQNPPQFSSLGLDLRKFRKVKESPDVPDLITYLRDDEGVAYTVEPDGTLHDIRYFPPSRYDHLRCSKRRKP